MDDYLDVADFVDHLSQNGFEDSSVEAEESE